VIRNVLALVLLSLFVGLSGCAVVPGSNITQNQLIDDRASEADMPRPAVSKITPLVIEQLRAQQPDAAKAVAPQSTHYVYKIGPGDILTVTVWDHPELTTPYGQFNDPEKQGNLVRDDGTFYYPYIGDVVAAGKTTQELRVELMTSLSEYIEAPQLDVKVAAFRSQRFYLTGAVEKPGTYPITDIPQTILDAVNLSGGLAENADVYDVTLTRGDHSSVVPLYNMLYLGDMSGNQVLAGDDVIHVARNEMRRVFLMGEVIDSQALPMTYRHLRNPQLRVRGHHQCLPA
jgi:polysaccharide export outer membrane protein